MTIKEWWQTRNTFPKYLFNCTRDSDSSMNSFFDLWSFAHIFWGCVFGSSVFLVDTAMALVITILLSVCYELFENSNFGRRLAAKVCCSKDYEGDNFWNSCSDVCCSILGFVFVLYAKTISELNSQ